MSTVGSFRSTLNSPKASVDEKLPATSATVRAPIDRAPSPVVDIENELAEGSASPDVASLAVHATDTELVYHPLSPCVPPGVPHVTPGEPCRC